VAIVTGAGSGIGEAIAIRLAEEGAGVVCADVAKASATAKQIADAGGQAVDITMDVRDSSGWDAAVSLARERYGTVDLLANVAGVLTGVATGVDTALSQTEEEWQRIIDINLKGYWLGMRAVLPGMLELGRGRIVNISSVLGIIGTPEVMAYSASKGGIAAMTRAVAVDHAKMGITVNAVAPGHTKTPIQDGLDFGEADLQAMIERIPAGRIGYPPGVAAMVAFLMSDEAGYITGQEIAVDGGWSNS
jgi:NAD(P)-dependent dehydrogenase (short-subunit alcohol dehydrogenase family)